MTDRQTARFIVNVVAMAFFAFVAALALLKCPSLHATDGGDTEACFSASRLPECRDCCVALGNSKQVCSKQCAKALSGKPVSPSGF